MIIPTAWENFHDTQSVLLQTKSGYLLHPPHSPSCSLLLLLSEAWWLQPSLWLSRSSAGSAAKTNQLPIRNLQRTFLVKHTRKPTGCNSFASLQIQRYYVKRGHPCKQIQTFLILQPSLYTKGKHEVYCIRRCSCRKRASFYRHYHNVLF